jgi:hypothetical protein
MEIFLGVLFCWMDDTPTLGALVIAQVVWAVFVVLGVLDFMLDIPRLSMRLRAAQSTSFWCFWSFGMLADLIFPRSGS